MISFRKFLKKYLNLLFLLVFYIVGGVFCYIYFSRNPQLLKDPQILKNTIENFYPFSELVFIGLQILQVVFFVIPGEIFQITSGYVFGPLYGFFLCIIGSFIGGTINFYIGRFAGRTYVENLIAEKHTKIFQKIEAFNGKPDFEKRISRDIFFLYLIPGMPKDVLGYFCGVTEVHYIHYILFSNLGKIPALLLSTFFGGSIIKLLSFF